MWIPMRRRDLDWLAIRLSRTGLVTKLLELPSGALERSCVKPLVQDPQNLAAGQRYLWTTADLASRTMHPIQ